MAIPPESPPPPPGAADTATHHGAGGGTPAHAELMQRHDRSRAAAGRLWMLLGLPVEDLASAGQWLASFADGEENYAGLGPGGAAWLAAQAQRVLDLAAALAITSIEREQRSGTHTALRTHGQRPAAQRPAAQGRRRPLRAALRRLARRPGGGRAVTTLLAVLAVLTFVLGVAIGLRR